MTVENLTEIRLEIEDIPVLMRREIPFIYKGATWGTSRCHVLVTDDAICRIDAIENCWYDEVHG